MFQGRFSLFFSKFISSTLLPFSSFNQLLLSYPQTLRLSASISIFLSPLYLCLLSESSSEAQRSLGGLQTSPSPSDSSLLRSPLSLSFFSELSNQQGERWELSFPSDMLAAVQGDQKFVSAMTNGSDLRQPDKGNYRIHCSDITWLQCQMVTTVLLRQCHILQETLADLQLKKCSC